ncbi:hypothetical protein D7X33_18995 [Butyricicoccus sp. 1XD8-22]|nr:hypothetical protein D7X33_18995 [Butyricicoccus sp. 1XD8-22]
MKALVYISPSLKTSEYTKKLIESLRTHFVEVKTETKETTFIELLNSNEYKYVLGIVAKELGVDLLLDGNTSIPVNFLTNNAELHKYILQKCPSADIFSSIGSLLQSLSKRRIPSTEPIIELEAPSAEELESILSESINAPIREDSIPPEPINEYTGHYEYIEDRPIQFIDISEDVLADDMEDEAIEGPLVKDNENVPKEKSKAKKTEVLKAEPKTDSSPQENSVHKDVTYEENPIYTRTRQIQKNLFAQQQWADHKIVGLWSPIGRTGVSTFAINFALYLAKNRVYTTVLEALTPQPQLKQTLSRYTKVPKGWISYASTIQEENDPRNASWIYDNVVFLPCAQSDLQYTWNPALIEAYMTTTKIVDVTLVDVPSGNLQEYSKDALNYVDELWILFDDNYHELMNWKQYIQELEYKFQIPIHLIMSRNYPFSQAHKISKEMGLPLISCIPAMDETAMYNHYQNIPLYYVEEAQEKLETAYYEVASHLFKQPFKPRKGENASSKYSSLFKKFYTSFLKA